MKTVCILTALLLTINTVALEYCNTQRNEHASSSVKITDVKYTYTDPVEIKKDNRVTFECQTAVSLKMDGVSFSNTSKSTADDPELACEKSRNNAILDIIIKHGKTTIDYNINEKCKEVPDDLVLNSKSGDIVLNHQKLQDPTRHGIFKYQPYNGSVYYPCRYFVEIKSKQSLINTFFPTIGNLSALGVMCKNSDVRWMIMDKMFYYPPTKEAALNAVGIGYMMSADGTTINGRIPRLFTLYLNMSIIGNNKTHDIIHDALIFDNIPLDARYPINKNTEDNTDVPYNNKQSVQYKTEN